jgi:riboflavin transporter FmnP
MSPILTAFGWFAAIAAVLMFFEFPLPVAPPFYKLDLSEIPVLIGTFAFGPIAGVVIEFLKIAVKTCDYLEKLYETAERTGEVQTAVCPSHYMGLAEMYRTTRDPRYLNLLKKAVALRDGFCFGINQGATVRSPLVLGSDIRSCTRKRCRRRRC